MRWAAVAAGPPHRLVVGVAVTAPRRAEEHVGTIGADRLDECRHQLLLVLGHRAVGEVEAGDVRVRGEDLRGATQLRPAHLREPTGGVGGRVRVRALTGRRSHDLDAPTRARGGVQQAARPEVSSSGCPPTTTTRPRDPGSPRVGTLARTSDHDPAVVPGWSCRKREKTITSPTPGRRGAAARGRPGRARRATGGGRARGRPPGARAASSVARGPGPRACAARTQDVLGPRRRPLTHAQCGPPADPVRARLPASRAAAACYQHGPGRRAAARRRRRGASTPPGRAHDVPDSPVHHAPRDPHRPAEPDGGHADRTPREAGPLEVPPGRPDGARGPPRRGRGGPSRPRWSPRATHVPATAVTSGWSEVDGEEAVVPRPTHALISAWSSRPRASTSACARRGRTTTRSASPATARPAPPQRTRPRSRPRPPRPACPRMAWASRCGSSTRATVRSAAATLGEGRPQERGAAAAVRRRRPPTSRARSSAAGTSPAAAVACSDSTMSSRRCSFVVAPSSTGRLPAPASLAWSCVICPPGSRATSRRVALRAEQDATSAHAPSGTSQGLVVVLVCRQPCAA